jgi:translocator protein
VLRGCSSGGGSGLARQITVRAVAGSAFPRLPLAAREDRLAGQIWLMTTTAGPRVVSRRGQAAAWAVAVGVYAAAQGVSAQASQWLRAPGVRRQYQEELDLPAFAPPGRAFPVAWSVLNITTATSAWRLWRADAVSGSGPASSAALAWWVLALAVRSGYVPLAFGRRRLWAATADSAALTAVMLVYARRARRDDQVAALLALPEIAWTAFATVLSAATADRNRVRPR